MIKKTQQNKTKAIHSSIWRYSAWIEQFWKRNTKYSIQWKRRIKLDNNNRKSGKNGFGRASDVSSEQVYRHVFCKSTMQQTILVQSHCDRWNAMQCNVAFGKQECWYQFVGLKRMLFSGRIKSITFEPEFICV